jgi:hypothetical protein
VFEFGLAGENNKHKQNTLQTCSFSLFLRLWTDTDALILACDGIWDVITDAEAGPTYFDSRLSMSYSLFGSLTRVSFFVHANCDDDGK